MQTIKASTVLDDIYRFIGWDSDQLEDRQKADARTAFSLALQEVWDAWWWEKLMVSAPAPLRTAYDPDTHGSEAVEVLGAAQTSVNGIWPAVDEENGRTRYSKDGLAFNSLKFLGDAEVFKWQIGEVVGGLNYARYISQDDEVTPDLADAWEAWPRNPILNPEIGADEPVPVVCKAGAVTNCPYSTGRTVRSISRFDPRTSRNAGCFNFIPTDYGVMILDLAVTRPWVWARRTTPVLADDCDEFDTALEYEATDPGELVFDS